MRQHYETTKKNVGLELAENYYDDAISDDVFAKIHPDANFKLSDLLKSKLSYNEIKHFVITHAGDLAKSNQFYHGGKEVRPSTRAIPSTLSRTTPTLLYAKQSIPNSSVSRTTPLATKATRASIKS